MGADGLRAAALRGLEGDAALACRRAQRRPDVERVPVDRAGRGQHGRAGRGGERVAGDGRGRKQRRRAVGRDRAQRGHAARHHRLRQDEAVVGGDVDVADVAGISGRRQRLERHVLGGVDRLRAAAVGGPDDDAAVVRDGAEAAARAGRRARQHLVERQRAGADDVHAALHRREQARLGVGQRLQVDAAGARARRQLHGVEGEPARRTSDTVRCTQRQLGARAGCDEPGLAVAIVDDRAQRGDAAGGDDDRRRVRGRRIGQRRIQLADRRIARGGHRDHAGRVDGRIGAHRQRRGHQRHAVRAAGRNHRRSAGAGREGHAAVGEQLHQAAAGDVGIDGEPAARSVQRQRAAGRQRPIGAARADHEIAGDGEDAEVADRRAGHRAGDIHLQRLEGRAVEADVAAGAQIEVGAENVDRGTVGEAGFGIDAAGRGELDRIAGGDVAEDEIAGGLLQIDALRRRDLVELVVGRVCERDLDRVRIVRGVASGGPRGTDIAVLGDQGQVADIT